MEDHPHKKHQKCILRKSQTAISSFFPDSFALKLEELRLFLLSLIGINFKCAIDSQVTGKVPERQGCVGYPPPPPAAWPCQSAHQGRLWAEGRLTTSWQIGPRGAGILNLHFGKYFGNNQNKWLWLVIFPSGTELH